MLTNIDSTSLSHTDLLSLLQTAILSNTISYIKLIFTLTAAILYYTAVISNGLLLSGAVSLSIHHC